jgi:aryl-alcohol dehydrogenase-like predicted oxidoreductase
MPDKFPDMQYRTLGFTGLKISVIGFGGWLTSHGGLEDKGISHKRGSLSCHMLIASIY